jgi:hypothetical protein
MALWDEPTEIKGKPLVTHAPGCKCLMCQGK